MDVLSFGELWRATLESQASVVNATPGISADASTPFSEALG